MEKVVAIARQAVVDRLHAVVLAHASDGGVGFVQDN